MLTLAPVARAEKLDAPIELGSIDTSDFAFGVSVVGGLAYVADNAAGLRVIDVSNPAVPAEVGSIDIPVANLVSVVGDLVYVANDDFGLRIIQAVPEPGAFLLQLAAVGAVLFIRRQSRRTASLESSTDRSSRIPSLVISD